MESNPLSHSDLLNGPRHDKRFHLPRITTFSHKNVPDNYHPSSDWNQGNSLRTSLLSPNQDPYFQKGREQVFNYGTNTPTQRKFLNQGDLHSPAKSPLNHHSQHSIFPDIGSSILSKKEMHSIPTQQPELYQKFAKNTSLMDDILRSLNDQSTTHSERHLESYEEKIKERKKINAQPSIITSSTRSIQDYYPEHKTSNQESVKSNSASPKEKKPSMLEKVLVQALLKNNKKSTPKPPTIIIVQKPLMTRPRSSSSTTSESETTSDNESESSVDSRSKRKKPSTNHSRRSSSTQSKPQFSGCRQSLFKSLARPQEFIDIPRLESSRSLNLQNHSFQDQALQKSRSYGHFTSGSQKAFNPRAKISALCWASIYPGLIKNIIRSRYIQKRKVQEFDTQGRFITIYSATQQYIVKIAKNDLVRMLNERTIDISLFNSMSDSNKRSRAVESVKEHFRTIINKLCKFAAKMSEPGAFLPSDFFSKFELERMEFNQDGALKNVHNTQSKLLLGGMVVLRIFLYNIIMQSSKALQYNFPNDQKSTIIGSLFYHSVMDYFKDLVPEKKMKPTYLNLLPEAKSEPLSVIEQNDTTNFDPEVTNGEQDIIHGFYNREKLEACFGNKLSGLLTDLKLLVGKWVDTLYQHSHETYLQSLRKSDKNNTYGFY